MKYNIGDKVRIKSLDWYNENKDERGNILMFGHSFFKRMFRFCGHVKTISAVVNTPHGPAYTLEYDSLRDYWTDEMIEGFVEEETLIERVDDNGLPFNEWLSHKGAFYVPDGYELKDENGNGILTSKIILEKKKKEYPKTYEECCEVLNYKPDFYDADKYLIYGYMCDKLRSFQKLLVCLDAYWKLYGEEMGLDKPWEPDYKNPDVDLYVIINIYNQVEKAKYGYGFQRCTFTFPTAEMRNDFKKNFDQDIEICKEFL